jgi:hypothetical protein
MNYTLLQVKPEHTRNNSNISADSRKDFGMTEGSLADPIVLDAVYEVVAFGTMDARSTTVLLHKLWEIYNTAHPEGFKKRSLMVGDIVISAGDAYYCDSFGWEKIVVTGTAL